ncbi:MAG: hypothetical protein HOP11_07430 [Saprospiraceae bacterium]|nr:hypothetical protein [Saprospiraceae bacterium]
MRAKSRKTNGYIIYAVAGTNTISFAIDFRKANTKGLLGFAIERVNQFTGERKFLDGFKVFKDVIKNPTPGLVVSTHKFPVQSFVWDDFGCYHNTSYTYYFFPVKGDPKNLKYESKIELSIRTEPLYAKGESDVFFNRGVASSQVYSNKFFNLAPDKMTNEEMKAKALSWLSRDLDNAILKFIENTKKGESLLGCFYEFHYAPVVEAFAQAIKRGAKVQIIVDAKENGDGDKEDFPRVENLNAIKEAGIPLTKSKGIIFQRKARPSAIQHNKFIVLLDKNKKAKEVWTGSTNISMGGIHGQTNVGHWIRNKSVSEKFSKYWELLKSDPGGKKGEDRSTIMKKNEKFRIAVEDLQANIDFNSWDQIPKGMTSVFSPRSGRSMLEMYARMFDKAESLSCITLAFGINEVFKEYLKDNTSSDHLSFMLLEKPDKKGTRSEKPFININASQNVYKSFGAAFDDELYNWTKEITTRHLGLNVHVAFVHSKFMLIDPLGSDPIVVTGSANFSEPSTNENDENMVIIRGDKRVADIYYTEFNRLFNHYYFRSVYQLAKNGPSNDGFSAFLYKDDTWLEKYKKGKLRYKRVDVVSKMDV